jgi:hypothetical protein
MNLIQSNVKYHIGDILSKCHEKKTTIYYLLLNVSVLTIFLVFTSCFLWVCYKSKPSDEELKEKLIRDQHYVLQQIRFYQGQPKTTSAITDLPVVEPHKHDITNQTVEVIKNGVYNPNIF